MKNTIPVQTMDETTRGNVNIDYLAIDDLSRNLLEFLTQVDRILKHTPNENSGFNLERYEIHAGIDAKGKFVLLGVGSEAGISGGLKFVFKRSKNNDKYSKNSL